MVSRKDQCFFFFQLGDTILEVNGRQMKDTKQFYKVIAVASPVATIKVRRPNSVEDLPIEVREKLGGDNLPPLDRRTGYLYSVFTDCFFFEIRSFSWSVLIVCLV